ncbi:unnamed protein product [Rhodiola kirilowii]
MKRKSESETTINHLPEDVLCQIFSHIDLNSTSLVSKLFCSLSSPLLHELYLSRNSSLTYSDLQMLFNRFTGVKKIYMINCLKLDNVLMAISNSGLNLEKLYLSSSMNAHPYPEPQTIEIMSTSTVIKSIKSLHLNDRFNGHPGKQQQQQLIEFIHMFPSLIEFDFTHLWDDNGIHKITLKLPNLQKVNIGYNIGAVTDKTLDILSSNCPKLDTVNFHWMFTPKALYTFFLNNPQLSSVHMPEFYSHSISEVAKCMQVLQNLSHLSLESNIVQDAVLIALAKSRPPLKSLRLGGCDNNYTMGGLIPLLSACPGLEELKIHLPVPNNNTHDAEMSIAVTRLPELKHIENRTAQTWGNKSILWTGDSIFRSFEVLKELQRTVALAVAYPMVQSKVAGHTTNKFIAAATTNTMYEVWLGVQLLVLSQSVLVICLQASINLLEL